MARDSLMIDALDSKPIAREAGTYFLNPAERIKELAIPRMRGSGVRAMLLLRLSAVLWF